jgi:serine/threonine-protein kinase
MPIAKCAESELAGRDAVGVVEAFVPLARTLAELHALGIHHRDIKIPNLLSLGGRLCFSDFGLVKYPGRVDVTQDKQSLGPKFLMAPEMRRNAQAAAGAPADVYSFAKALWVALTRRDLAFDGQYLPEGGLGLSKFHSGLFFAPLDDLLAQCTNDDPALRPTIDDVGDRLAEWVAMMNDFHKRNLKEWIDIQTRIFPRGFPQRVVWTGIDEICAILKLVAGTGSLNHTFLPSGGGQDLTEVALTSEPGLIRLKLGTNVVFKPKSLSFESFGPGSPWNYFRLEAEEIPPSGTPGAVVMPGEIDELLCELTPGTYISPYAWENGEYLGRPLPHDAEPVTRTLKGAFMLVAKRSWYNLDATTYDARHQQVSGDAFRDYIAQAAARNPNPPPSRS